MHPQLISFATFISSRRASRLDGAAKWLAQLEKQYTAKQAAEERAIWSWWGVRVPVFMSWTNV
jgi:hypothetical protein